MYEFKATIPDGCKVLEAYSVSHGKASAWLPVIELLKSYFEIADEDDDSRRSEKVEAKVRGLDPALAETLPYILSLLGIAGAGASLAMMDAQIRRRRTLEAIKRIIIRESLKQPLVVIFEDLHWIDAETQELLDLLVDSVASARILMLVNYRPEYHHEWGNRTCYTQLRLDPLGGQSADEMLHALLGGDASLQSLKRLIIEKTQGNPFFMEEIVRALVEQGVLVRNGATRLTKPLTEIHIPPTVHGILASRIDALPASEKGPAADLGGHRQRLPAESGQAYNCQPGRSAGADVEGLAGRRVHLRATRIGGSGIYLQARAHAGGGVQLGADGAPPALA